MLGVVCVHRRNYICAGIEVEAAGSPHDDVVGAVRVCACRFECPSSWHRDAGIELYAEDVLVSYQNCVSLPTVLSEVNFVACKTRNILNTFVTVFKCGSRFHMI